MNLLEETTSEIERAGHTLHDVVYIGDRMGRNCTMEQFQILADREYDDGYGSTEVAVDLTVVFRDGSYLRRESYDGSEYWIYEPIFTGPVRNLPISTLFGKESTLEECNKWRTK